MNTLRTPLATAASLRRMGVACVLAAGWLTVALAQAQSPAQPDELGHCGSLRNGYGPYDYRTDKQQLAVVEAYHFSSAVEQLIRGMTGSIGSDLDYTLRASPNHHRALSALSRYGEKEKTDLVRGAQYTVECYFIRAVNFRPDDPTVRMLFAIYLKGQNRVPDAAKQLAYTETLADISGFTLFNLGLVYLDLGDPDAALRQAHKAMALGFTRPELKARLLAAGKWSEPPSATAAADAASAPQ
jgi:hypothetical protein